MKQKRVALPWLLTALLSTGGLLGLLVPREVHAIRNIAFPVLGGASYSNDFDAPRTLGGVHRATDIFARKGQQIVSATDGTVTFAPFPQPSYGWMIGITDDDGYTYNYIHMNNDTPGTDDGQGGPMHAYAPDMKTGNKVVRGQLLGWVGDSGNAETTPPHLHFEIIRPDNSKENPFDSLNAAQRLPWPTTPPQMPNELLPYGLGFKGGISVAMGNIDADPESEMITGAGRGGGSHVRFFDDNDMLLNKDFMAYNPKFQGGVELAMGDVDGDGTDEIITAPASQGSAHVRVIRANGTEMGGFYAYNPRFTGGIKVGAGDVDGDGNDEIITAPSAGGGPHVRIFEADGTEVGAFMAYAASFNGGIDIAAGDVTGDTKDEIVTAPGPGGGSHIRVLGPNGTAVSNFSAYGSGYTGGARVSVGNVRTGTAKEEIVTVPASHGSPHIRMTDYAGTVITSKMFMEQWWSGFHDVAAGYDTSRAATGTNRRASVRAGLE